jgi:nucleotide-binding universal stress UspA family protein
MVRGSAVAQISYVTIVHRKDCIVIEIRRILCPVDYSEHSRRALDYAIGIARWYDSTVTVFHVVSLSPAMAYSTPVAFPAPAWLPATDRTRIFGALKEFARAEGGSIVPIEVDVGEGNPATEILAKSTAMSNDLLVLGTHGLSGFDRLLLGSVTEKVLRKAACPVLSVPSHAPDLVPVAPALFRRILCAVDFSKCSLHALQYALSLAQEANASLLVLNVLELPVGPSDPRAPAGLPHGLLEYVAAVESNRRNELAALVPDEAKAYCSVETRLLEGKPYQEILRVAEEEQIDLIVMGVRGRGAADLLLFGSTVQHVVRQASCPVLTLRAC